LDAREAFYDSHNRSQFGLAARQTLQVSVNDPAMGSVTVNLVDTRRFVSAAQPTWTGRYYPGVPVTLEARPRPGFSFVGWQGASSASARRITQTLVANAGQPVQLTAVFAAVAAPAAPVIAPLGSPAFRTGDLAKMQVSASQANGYAITYSAKTLPKGLAIIPASGVIYGRVSTPGVYASTVSASDGLNTTNLSVSWTISDRPGTGVLGSSPDSGPPSTNVPPTVALTAPAAGASFAQGSTVTVSANAGDSDGSVARVDFYDGANLIGSDTTAPYSFLWAGAGVGVHGITALAVDNVGANTTSAAVSVTVNPPGNTLPTVSLVAPADNSSFVQGSLITVTAAAADADGSVARVEFYDGSSLLATLTSPPYTIAGSNVALGTHVVSAVAVDNQGASTRSAPITLSVVTAPVSGGGTGTGLVGRYFANLTLSGAPVLQRTEAVAFDWGLGVPGPGLPADDFSVRWEGWIETPVAGSYRLQTQSDDGVRVWVNGSLVIEHWGAHAPAIYTSVPLAATAGRRYSIVV
jgi:PA14 domain/Bacterial Ig domain/Divergent InlB B-repeat domain